MRVERITNKKKPSVRLTPEEREIIDFIRANPEMYEKYLTRARLAKKMGI